MNKKELRYSINRILGTIGNLKCEDVHHKNTQLHEAGYVCPALYELHRHVYTVEKYFKEQKVL